MPQQITEAGQAVNATPVEGKPGRFLIQLITPGKGSSGIYSEAVLKQAAADRIWPTGTRMFLDHPTWAEAQDRPEGSVKDWAATLTEDAYWDGNGLAAEAEVYSPFAALLAERKDWLGVSIRAAAEVSQGPQGRVVDKLIRGESVDFVTMAGRGGKVLAVLESARHLTEATTRDRSDQLQRALPGHSYVRDYDPDTNTVYFETYDEASGRSTTYAQTYEAADDDQSVTLTGQPTEVRVITTFVPVGQQAATEAHAAPTNVPATPAGQTTQEHNMAQIDDQELATLRESAGRVSTLERERDEARTKLAESEARTAATTRARNALAADNLPAPTIDRIVAESTRTLPLRDGSLDVAAFDAQVATAKEAETAYLAAIRPAGGAQVVGFGQSAPVGESAARPTANPWGRSLSSVKGA